MQKKLLILGSSSDIAIKYLQQYATNYHIIVAHYNNDSTKLQQLNKELERKIELVQADFSDEDKLVKFPIELKEKYSDFTHIIHFSSEKVKNCKYGKSEWNEYNNSINIQVRSIYEVLKVFLPIMSKNKYGKIVFTLSSCVKGVPPKYWGNYVMAKYSLLGLMKLLSSEYANKNININGVSPSMVETDFLENIPSLIVEKNAKLSPLERNAKTDDIVPVIDFLLSEESKYIMGQNILISGGKN